MSYRIVVDSCCELTPQMKEESCYTSIPLTIMSNGLTFVDDETFVQADLIRAMKQSPDAPTTSCPSPQAYLDAYDCGVDDVYVVTLSARLSGSYNSAHQAKLMLEEEKPEIHVHVFNSCSAVSGETLIAMKIQELAGSGMPFEQVVEEVEQFIAWEKTLFVLEDLENLRKNGRLTRMQAIVTGALKIKLLCHATPEGEIEKVSQALTMKQALMKLIDRIAGDADHEGRAVVINHCNCLDRALMVKDLVEKKCRFAAIHITEAAGITTVYANDGGIVVAY